MKTGEKVLFGGVALIVVISLGNFAVLEWIGLTSKKPLSTVQTSKTSYDFSDEGLRGFRLYRKSGCYSCHRAIGSGTNMGLTLDGIGSKRSLDYLYNFLKEPEKTYRGAKTVLHAPTKEAAYVSALPDADLRAIAVFMSQLKADRGAASAFQPPKGESSFIDAMLGMWVPAGWINQFKDVRDAGKSKEEKEQEGQQRDGSR